jgi:glycosyltransferase involved in cell wall biosynthesis
VTIAPDAPARPPLVYVSPLPTRRNGIADYAATILMRLTAHYQCVCVVDEVEAVDGRIAEAVQVMSFREYAAVAPSLAQERHLCHLGNNSDHIPILDLMSDTPAVAVVHDLTMHYLMERWAQSSFGSTQRIADVARLYYGGRGAELVDAKFNRGATSQSIYAELNCLPFLNTTARAVITHSHYGHVLARAGGYTGPLRMVPHFAEIPAPQRQARSRAEWRARFGADEETVIFTSLGFVVPNKQISLALAALAELPPTGPDWRYVIGGENRDPRVLDTCRALGLQDRVIFLDYLDEADFDAVLAASDLLINLRFPTSGETSGTVCRALANGLPCIVSNHGWYAELPDAATYKLRPGTDVLDELARVLLIGLLDAPGRAARAAAALDYARRELTLDSAVEAYRAVIEAAYATPPVDAPRQPEVAAFTQPRPLLTATRAPSDLAAMLALALANEQVSLAGRPLPAEVLPGGFDLAALARTPGAGSAAPRQIFAALEADDAIGGILAAALDAAARTRPGDFLTLALVSARPDRPHPPGWLHPLRPHLPEGGRLADRLARILAEAGFTPVRGTEIALTPAESGDDYRRIVLATVRRSAVVRPALAYFRDTA